jgi:DnaK suppressor protein
MTINASSPHAVSGLTDEQRERIEASLREAAASRERQLAELPTEVGDLVAAAHRDSVARILAEIRSAQVRLRSGQLGRCARCAERIPVARLELRPWTTLCVGCAHVVHS